MQNQSLNTLISWRAFILTMAVAVAPCQSAETSPRVTVEEFFAEPDIRGLQVSPDGSKAAFLTTLATGKVGIALMHLDTGKVEPLVGGKDEN